MRIVGVEEHFVVPELLAAWQSLEPRWQDLSLVPSVEGESARRLADLGDERFAAAAETGIDVQVLSLTTPGVQNLAPGDAVALQTLANDRLADWVRADPDRRQGLAALATPAPAQAAEELRRAVTELGLNGAMLYGRTRERNLDDHAFLPIFEAAADLRAPVHLHPQSPSPTVRSAYYEGLSPALDSAFATHGIGWHYDAGVQLLRLILRGVFDRLPDLQVIVGHWGEVVLFFLDRIEHLAAAAKLERPISDYFRSNVFVAPSGTFSQRYLRWAIDVIGVERILFSTDYPFEFAPDRGARSFLQVAGLGAADTQRIAAGNWDGLCAGIRR